MLQRRNLAIMLALCLLLTVCSGFMVAAKEENLIVNGDFEQGTAGWMRTSKSSALSAAQFESAIKVDGDGNHYLCYDKNIQENESGITNAGVVQSFTLKKDTEYTLSFRYAANEGATPVYCVLSGGGVSNLIQKEGDENYHRQKQTGGTWKSVSYKFKTAADFDESASCQLTLYYNQTIAPNDEYAFMLDDVELYEETVKETPKPIVTGKNLLTNSDFSTGTSDWTRYKIEEQADFEKTLKDDGTGTAQGKYLCFDASVLSGVKNAGIRRALSLEAGESYVLTYRYAATNGSNPVYGDLYVNGERNMQWRYKANAGEWEKVTVAFITPETLTSAELFLYYGKTIADGDSFMLDDIELYKADEYVCFAYPKAFGGDTMGDVRSLGTSKNGYNASDKTLNARVFSATKQDVLFMVGIYKTDNDKKQLVHFYSTELKETDYDTDNLYRNISVSMDEILTESGSYTAKVFGWDGISGLIPLSVVDSLSFTYESESAE